MNDCQLFRATETGSPKWTKAATTMATATRPSALAEARRARADTRRRRSANVIATPTPAETTASTATASAIRWPSCWALASELCRWLSAVERDAMKTAIAGAGARARTPVTTVSRFGAIAIAPSRPTAIAIQAPRLNVRYIVGTSTGSVAAESARATMLRPVVARAAATSVPTAE